MKKYLGMQQYREMDDGYGWGGSSNKTIPKEVVKAKDSIQLELELPTGEIVDSNPVKKVKQKINKELVIIDDAADFYNDDDFYGDIEDEGSNTKISGGVSIMELMLSLGIFAVVVFGVISMFSAALKASAG